MKHRPIFLILFALFCLSPLRAQEASVSTAKWNRLESADKDFSVSFPPAAIVDAEDRKYSQKLKIAAFQNNVEMELLVIEDGNVRERSRNVRPSDPARITTTRIGDFSVMQLKSAAGEKTFQSTFWITKKDKLYIIKANAKTGQEAELSRFLFSVNLDGKPLFPRQEKIDLPEAAVPLSALKTSPEVTEAFARKIEKNKINITYEASSNDLNEINYDALSRRAVIVERPFPELSTGYAGTRNGTFSVRLKVNFLASGQIGDIVVLSVENKDFSKACIEAARKIRFVPAQSNGKNADSVEIVEYTVQIFSVPGTYVRPR